MAKSSDLDGLRLAMGVGTALSAWAGFEVRLTHLFSVLTDMPDQAKACEVFDTVISFEVRLAMCDRLMLLEDSGDLEKSVWRAFKRVVDKSHKKRHGIAHFSIVEMTSKRDKRTVYLSPFLSQSKLVAGRPKLLTAKDLSHRSNEFHELREAVVWFWASARARRGLGAEPPSPVPALIARIEASLAPSPQSPS